MPPIDRILSQYSNPIRSWPGEEDLDAEARANYEAANPPKLQTEGGSIDKGDLLPIVRYPEAKTSPSEWQSSSDVMRQLDDGWRIEPFSRITAPFKSMAEAWRNQPVLGPMVRPSQMHPEAFSQMSGDAMTVAGAGMTGGIGRAAVGAPVPHGVTELGIFGGRKAKTADLDALARAEEMVRLGRPRDEIWNDTGWFQGPDKQWRFEIDDSGNMMTGEGANYHPGRLRSEILDQAESREAGQKSLAANGYQGRLDQILDHKDVFAAYPDLAGTTWASVPGEKMAIPNVGGIWKGDRFGMEINADYSPRLQTGKSITLHELQHGIQDAENFARGANVRMFELDPEQIAGGHRQLAEMGDAEIIRETADRHQMTPREAAAKLEQDFGRAPDPEAIFIAEIHPVSKIQEMAGRIRERLNDATDPKFAYNRTAGEAEARLVQKRIDMTDAERKARPPWLDYDVPETDQIVRSGNESGAMSAGPKYPMAPRDRWYGEANYETTGGQMREMTPDEFLRAARPLDPSEELTRENINDLKRHIQEGGELDPLQLYKGGKEDGRHRAYAAKELGIERVPVIDFRGDVPSSPTLMASIDPLAAVGGGGKSPWERIKAIDSQAGGDVARAIDEWVGGSHDARAKGIEGGIMMPQRLEQLPPDQLRAAAQPVRDILRDTYGDYVTVYRGESGGNPSTGRQGVLNSYTTDRAVAERFAGARTPEMKLISGDEVQAAQAALDQRGEAQMGGKVYRREDDGSIGIYDRNGNLVTDTDSLANEAASYNEFASRLNAERAEALGRVREVQIPVEDVVWATDRFGQKEIIARANAERPAQQAVMASMDPLTAAISPRSIDPLGYYSPTLDAALRLSQKKGTPEQMLAQLKKAGAKDSEIEVSGLKKMFEGKKSVSQDEIVKALEEGKVGLQEAVYRNSTDDAELRAEWDRLSRVYAAAERRGDVDAMDATGARISEIDGMLSESEGLGATRHADYSLDPENPTYREVVLHLPPDAKAARSAWEAANPGKSWDSLSDADRSYLSRKHGGAEFQSGHFDEPNIVGHMMVSETRLPLDVGYPAGVLDEIGQRIMLSVGAKNVKDLGSGAMDTAVKRGAVTPDEASAWSFHHFGNRLGRDPRPRVLTLDQVQSDWGQRIRDGGARDEGKIAELKAKIAEVDPALKKAHEAYKAGLDEYPDSVGTENIQKLSQGLFGRPYEQLSGEQRLELSSVASENNRKVTVLERARKDLQSQRALLEAELKTWESQTPGHPLVNTTDQWLNTTLRRAIRMASEEGQDYIAIPSGRTVLGYNPGQEKGMLGFYGGMPEEMGNVMSSLKQAATKAPNEPVINVLDPQTIDALASAGILDKKKIEGISAARVLKNAESRFQGIVPKNLQALLQKLDKNTPPPQVINTLDSPSGKTGLGEGFTVFKITPEAKKAAKEGGQPLFRFGGRVTR